MNSNWHPIVKGRIRKETWGGLHYYRELPAINVINEAAYVILSHCDGAHTIADIERLLLAHFEAPAEQLEADLEQYLQRSVQHGFVTIAELPKQPAGSQVGDRGALHDKELLDRIGVIGVGANVLAAPIKVLIETTHNCNLKCVHCFADAACEPQNSLGYLPGELSAAEWGLVLDNLARAGVFDVFVSGGEPLLRKDIFTIIEHAKRCGLGFCLLTNLTLMDESSARRLKELGCYKVEGNLDGPDAATYDEFRGVAGAFELSLKGIKACQKAGLPLRLNMTATKRNIHLLKDIVRRAVALEVRELCVIPLEQGGRARSQWRELALLPEDHVELQSYYREVATWVRETYGNQFCYIGPCDYMLDDPDNEVFKLIDPNRIMPMCGAGKFHCSIAPNGQVILCPTAGDAIKIVPGDAVHHDFTDIWHNAEVFKTIRNVDISSCRTCEYKNCGGGCQVNAFLAHGELGTHPDEYCRKVFQAKLKRADRQQQAAAAPSTARD